MPLFRFFRRASTPPPEPAKPEPRPTAAPPAAPPPRPEPIRPAAPPASPVAPTAPVADTPDDVAQAIEMFETIQQVMKSPRDVVAIPARVLLDSLPPELRGPAWDGRPLPDVSIELEREPLVRQLQKGRVVYPLNDLTVGLPPGWVKSDVDQMVELNLAELVSALPPDLFQISAQLDEELIEVAQMRDYFKPKEEPKPVEPVAAPVTEPAAAAVAATARPQPLVRREVPLTAADGWDGVEHVPDAGPEVVDINEAGVEALAKVPGLGVSRARLIVAYREQFGPFRSIFELLAVPGIGRTVFRKATGLEPGLRKRRDRHTVLGELLGLPKEERPSLARIVELLAAVLPARACVLAGSEGFVLAQSPGLEPGDAAARYAAIVPKLFRRARRYLRQLSQASMDVIALPTVDPPILAVVSPGCHLIVLLHTLEDLGAVTPRAVLAGGEIAWLLSRRAVVRARH